VIAFQLPNWVEAAAVFWAASFLGAVVVPIVGVVGRDFDDLLADAPMPGVIHSHQTLGFETRQLAGLYPPDRGRQLTAAHVGHFIGMVNAFLIPVLDGTPVNPADVWDPQRILTLMAEENLTVGGGATYYVTSLLDHPDFLEAHLGAMKYAGLGGAPVPAAVTDRLEALGIIAFRSYGSTEQPSITASLYSAPAAKRLYTDGNPLEGVEIRPTAEAEILSRGPDLCLGYTDDAMTARPFDDDGWYRTGTSGCSTPTAT
jgi:acyl-CoA synthetase